MRLTRRGWTTVAAVAVTAALAPILDSVVPLAGGVLALAWIAGHQVRFARTVGGLDPARLVDTRVPDASGVAAGDPVTATVTLSPPTAMGGRATVDPPVPLAATGASAAPVDTAAGATATSTVTVTFPTAGSHEWPAPAVECTDASGLFATTVTGPDGPTVTVAPRQGRDLHVGAGGDRVALAAGDHEAAVGQRTPEPAELREYQPDDPARNIDWKASARLTDTYVREFEASGDRETLLVVDRAASMAAGPPGGSKLDCARALALAVLDHPDNADDPVGLVTVDDGGIRERFEPGASSPQRERIRESLRGLDAASGRAPVREGDAVSDDGTTAEETAAGVGPTTGASEAIRRAARLAEDDSAFGQRLGPFFGDADAYVERVAGDARFGAVRRLLAERGGRPRVLVFTDDRDPAALREIAGLAGPQGPAVTFVLFPGPVFASDAIAAPGEARADYAAFERLRRDLAARPAVAAYEAGPAARIERVIAATSEVGLA